MLCLSGFELYSRWVPLRVVLEKGVVSDGFVDTSGSQSSQCCYQSVVLETD